MYFVDIFWLVWIFKFSLNIWFDRVNDVMDQYELVIDVDERFVFDEVIGIWYEEIFYFQDMVMEVIVEGLRQECCRIMVYWQEQVRFNKFLRWY